MVNEPSVFEPLKFYHMSLVLKHLHFLTKDGSVQEKVHVNNYKNYSNDLYRTVYKNVQLKANTSLSVDGLTKKSYLTLETFRTTQIKI